ncbi:uncharacterized protein [Miscanthus floridulus]|uniref:uncharacterized protein n=1 Tax=Miscanthus floridulus TaxID=154761 RepID=UPI00345A9F82
MCTPNVLYWICVCCSVCFDILCSECVLALVLPILPTLACFDLLCPCGQANELHDFVNEDLAKLYPDLKNGAALLLYSLLAATLERQQQKIQSLMRLPLFRAQEGHLRGCVFCRLADELELQRCIITDESVSSSIRVMFQF